MREYIIYILNTIRGLFHSREATEYFRKSHEDTIKTIWDSIYENMYSDAVTRRIITFPIKATYTYDNCSMDYYYGKIPFGNFYEIESGRDYEYLTGGGHIGKEGHPDNIWVLVRDDGENVTIMFKTGREYLAASMYNLMLSASADTS
jgi:hypothetical protein